MVTWSGARTKVRGDLWRTGTTAVPDDVCDRALHSSILELETGRRWLWLENLNTTLTMASAASQLAAPTGLSSVTSLAYLSGTTGFDLLTPLPLARVRELSRGTSAGKPSHYALSGGILYFDTVVAIGDDFELIYTARTGDDLATVVAAGDTNVTLLKHEHAVIKGACAEVAQGYLKNDAEFERQRAAFERALYRIEQIEDEARSDNYGGLILPDTSYSEAAFGPN